MIGAKYPGWLVIYDPYSRQFSALAYPHGVPARPTDRSAVRIRGCRAHAAAGRLRPGPYCEEGSPRH